MQKSIHPAITTSIVVILALIVVAGVAYFSGPHQPQGGGAPGVPPWKAPGAKGYNPQGNYGPKYKQAGSTSVPPSSQAKPGS